MPKLRLVVEAVRDETPTIRSVRLSLAGADFPFKPGQYCLFAVKPGVAHSLSIASAPGLGYLEFAVRKSDSDFKKAFWELSEGSEVDVAGPLGGFTYSGGLGHAVFLSGGIGITPIKSMLEAAVARGEKDRLTLLFANRSPDEIPFREALEQLAAGGVGVVSTLDAAHEGWQGRTGHIDELLIRQAVVDLDAATFFICGPPGMVDAMAKVLSAMGVPEARVRIEHFDGY